MFIKYLYRYFVMYLLIECDRGRGAFFCKLTHQVCPHCRGGGGQKNIV